MKIGELFVNLGLKGGDKTVGTITGVKKGMGEVKSMSLEAKAAILGVMYAVGRMMDVSGRQGTDLRNFNLQIGMSAVSLQKYQYAAKLAGVQNGAVENTFRSLRDAMVKIRLNQGHPEGMPWLSKVVGGISRADTEKFAKQPELLFQKLREFVAKEPDPGIRDWVLKSFGLGDNMIAALLRDEFNPAKLAKAPAYSEAQLKSLDEGNRSWIKLGDSIEKAMGSFNAQFGGKIVSELTPLVGKVLELAAALVKLGEASHFFELLGMALDGWTEILDGLKQVIEFLSKETPEQKSAQKDALASGVADTDAAVVGFMTKLLNSFGVEIDSSTSDGVNKVLSLFNATRGFEDMQKSVKPAKPHAAAARAKETTVNVNQTMNFAHPGENAREVGDSTRQAAQQTFRAIPQGGT